MIDKRPNESPNETRDSLMQRQRGLHWVDWLSRLPAGMRPAAIAFFVSAVVLMIAHRWFGCL